MASFAQLDDNNNVINVIAVNNYDTSDENLVEKEEIGVANLKKMFGENTNWKQCSYNSKIRKNYPSIGWIYREDLDIFIPPRPFTSWTFNIEAQEWVAPIPSPPRPTFDDNNPPLEMPKVHMWDEENRRWYLPS